MMLDEGRKVHNTYRGKEVGRQRKYKRRLGQHNDHAVTAGTWHSAIVEDGRNS